MSLIKFIIIISIILIFISGIFLYISGDQIFKKSKFLTETLDKYRFWKKEPIKEKPVERRLMIKAQDELTKHYLDAYYIYGRDIGVLFSNIWEELILTANNTYKIKAYKKGYYYGENNCYLDKEKQESKCIIQLRPHGTISLDIHKKSINQIFIRPNIKDGYINNPIFCLRWDYISNIREAYLKDKTSITQTELPFEIQYKYDHCYYLQENIQEKARIPPLTKSKVIKEINNLLSNCTEHHYLIENTKDIIKSPCNSNISKESVIKQLSSFYKYCYELTNESQRDMANSIIAFYDECIETADIEELEINLDYYNEPDNDIIEILILDEGDYIDQTAVQEGYFGINSTDAGIENYEHKIKI